MDGKEIVALWATTCVPNTNISPWDLGQLAILIDAAIAQAVAAEREACADIADAEADTAFEEATPSPSSGEPRIRCENIASDIRARKNP